MNVGINIGMNSSPGKKYRLLNAVADWYGESLTYKYGGEDKMEKSSKF